MILPSSIQDVHEEFVLKKIGIFEKAESIESIFAHLSFYLSYIDFCLLEHIIITFGSEFLKETMSCYVKDMREFRKRTTISQALPYIYKRDILPSPDISRITVKISLDIEVATLEDLDEYRKSFANRFLLSHLAFLLANVQDGSLLVTWLVPIVVGAYIRDEMKDETSSSFFILNNILNLSLDGEQLYPAPTKVHL